MCILFLSFVCSIQNYYFQKDYVKKTEYLKYVKDDSPILIFFLYIILLNTMIPISLVVSIEIVKFI